VGVEKNGEGELAGWEDEWRNTDSGRWREVLCTNNSEAEKNWIGHVMRGDSLLKFVVEGRMVGKKPTGTPGMSMIDDLKEGSYPKWKEGLKIETNGGHGCQGPAVRQRINDDVSLTRQESHGLLWNIYTSIQAAALSCDIIDTIFFFRQFENYYTKFLVVFGRCSMLTLNVVIQDRQYCHW
jgi:hypothetical protein